jgi:phage shock protein A
MKFIELIFEGREDDFKTTYANKFSPEKLEAIINMVNEVPGSTKFLTFLGRVLPNTVTQGIVDDTVKPILKKFVAIGPNLQIKDINQYKTFAELNDAINQYENRIRREVQTIEGADLVYEDEKFTVVAPLTTKASCYYGAGTKWCTASSADNTHFNNYMNEGKLFYFIDKTKPTSDRFYKVALLKKFEGDESYFDAPDQKFTSGWIIGTDELEKIKKVINDYLNSKYADKIELYKDKERVRAERARIENERRRAITNSYLEATQERRQNNEWDPEVLDNGDEGSCAWALFNYLVQNGDIQAKTPENITRIEEINSELRTLRQTYDNIENANEITDLVSDIESLEDELEELNNLKDVYDMIPLNGKNYELYRFTTTDFESEWHVGDSASTEQSALESVQSLLDDVGYDGFNPNFVESHIDEEQWRGWLNDFFESDVYENPESYLEESDRELSRGQVARIAELNDIIKGLEFEKDSLDDEDEEYESEYERLNDEITILQEEIQEIEDDPDGEYDSDKLDRVVNNIVNEYRNDMESFLSNYYGVTVGEFIKDKDMIDEKSLIQDVVDSDGYGVTLNSWDGSSEEVSYNGDTYYLFDNGELSI